ncbi:MAG: AAA family ATPase [Magnetococcales bacterium]|nr:AAA family ATPase [Magnetococcales bacterium]
MPIETIRVKNYRLFQDMSVTHLPNMAVLLGANGSGKSTFFDIFSFLQETLENNVRSALQRRGGFREVVTRGHETESIQFEIQLRMEITGRNRLVTYVLTIGQDGNRPVVEREILRYKRGTSGSPFHFLDFSRGKGYAITNEEDFHKTDGELLREDQTLDSPDLLAIKGLGQFRRFKAANAFRSLIENWHVSDFHISAARNKVDAGVAEHLSRHGDNLALVAQHLHENHPDIFALILSKMRDRVPGVERVEAASTSDGYVVLRFQDGRFQDPFSSRFVSDGTIKMFAYLVLLHDPKPHPLMAIEEPENQLYPQLLLELAEEFRSYAQRGGQAFISTHSPDFLNGVRLEEIFLLRKQNGVSSMARLADSSLLTSLVKVGDLPGAMWKQGLFDGIAP